MPITYRNDSPNTKTPGKRMLTTVELLQKRAALNLKAAELSCRIAAGETGLKGERTELRRRIAVIDVRMSERVVSV
jgi:hypothetical protein